MPKNQSESDHEFEGNLVLHCYSQFIYFKIDYEIVSVENNI